MCAFDECREGNCEFVMPFVEELKGNPGWFISCVGAILPENRWRGLRQTRQEAQECKLDKCEGCKLKRFQNGVPRLDLNPEVNVGTAIHFEAESSSQRAYD